MILLAFILAAGPARVLTLEEALRTARERQPQLRQAHAATEAASARASSAFSSLLPQLSATAGYQRTNRSTSSIEIQSGAFHNSFSDSITASQLLWDFGTAPNRWRAARAQAESAGNSERASALQV